jgi:hypothetical protein
MRTVAISLLLSLEAFTAPAEVPPRVQYDATKIVADPGGAWIPDLKPYRAELRACLNGEVEAFLKIEKIAPDGDGESQDSRLLWLVLHVWGDAKFSKFLTSQSDCYRQLTSRALWWTYDEGDWHDPIPVNKLEVYVHTYFPATWQLVAQFPKPRVESTPPCTF